jgi:hypothetical protein
MRLLLAGILLLRTGSAAARANGVSTCPASPVYDGSVNAGVIRGLIDPETDVVDGRFRLHVGEQVIVASPGRVCANIAGWCVNVVVV